MKAEIFYFSGTGNTHYAAKKLAFYLNQVDIDTHFHSIEAIDTAKANDLINESDIVIFGYPIYGSYIPEPMLNFIDKTESVVLKTAGVFCTQFMYSGDGSKVFADILNEKGYLPKWSVHFNMPNNLNCGAFSFMPVTNDEEKLRAKLLKTNRSIKRMAKYIYKDKVYLQDFSTFSKSLGKAQRPNEDREYLLGRWSDKFSVNQETCSACGLCKDICPMENIEQINGNFTVNENCCGCQRCYNFCPTMSIVYKGKPSDKERYHGPTPKFKPIELKKV